MEACPHQSSKKIPSWLTFLLRNAILYSQGRNL
ncbi:hypothetical protein CsSME_00053627 [Camellia sinensis var. sinensis]